MRMALLFCVAAVAAQDIVVEGQRFTEEQAKRVLKEVNTASFETLHYTYDIYDYKTDNIINGRYYSNLRQLGRVDGVTPFVLALLRDKVLTCPSSQDKVLELASTLSFSELRDTVGIWREEAVADVFRKRPFCTYEQLEEVIRAGEIDQLRSMAAQLSRTEGSHCSVAEPCAHGYLCTGLSFNPVEGICLRSSHGGIFLADSHASPESVVLVNVTRFDGAMVAVDVVLSLDFESTAERGTLKNVRIEAEDPQGTHVLVWNGQDHNVRRIPTFFSVPNSHDDGINGVWKIIFSNPTGTAAGTAMNIKLWMTSRFD